MAGTAMGVSLAGKIAVVTGAGRGIGAATARLFAAEGARVVLASRTASELEATASAIAATGAVHPLIVPTDLADEAAISRLVRRTLDQWGDLHALVNNAGAFRGGPVEEMTSEAWDTVMAVNVRGTF